MVYSEEIHRLHKALVLLTTFNIKAVLHDFYVFLHKYTVCAAVVVVKFVAVR